MTSTSHKPDTAPVLFDQDYRDMIMLLLERLEKRDITIYDLQTKVKAYVARYGEIGERVR